MNGLDCIVLSSKSILIKTIKCFLAVLPLSVIAGSANAPQICDYGTKAACPDGMYCVYVDDVNQAECKDEYIGTLAEIYFPFGPNKPTACWKTVDPDKASSHAWLPTRFAADLYADKEKINNIYAGLDGKVIAIGGCEAEQPQCNLGFGNQVKILSDNGIMIFYAHLSEIFVKTGQFVKVGELIGKEGQTGNVGGMWGKENDFHHVHLSVHYDWRELNESVFEQPYPGIPSIPFILNACEVHNETQCNIKKIDVRTMRCLKFNKEAPMYMSR